jgi:hypothetical protein
MAGHFVGRRGHVGYSGRVDPVVVELKERAHRDRVVERFVRPAGGADPIHIVLANRSGVANHFLDEGVERAILFREGCCLDVVQDTLDELPVAQQLSRDRGVRADSENALVQFGGQRRDQLTLAGKEWRRAAHHFLAESRQVVGSLGLEGEEMEYLGDRDPSVPHLAEYCGVRLGGLVRLDRVQVHGLHREFSPWRILLSEKNTRNASYERTLTVRRPKGRIRRSSDTPS